MSRGFVKEDDQEEAPFIPPRAPLPDGVTNYVTPHGMRLLHDERTALEQERAATLEDTDRSSGTGDDDRRRTLAVINGRLDLLNERIASARVVEPGEDTPEEVRFGNSVEFEYMDGPQRGTRMKFMLVGVDEADVKQGSIAFTAPIARALIGKRIGDIAEFHLGGRVQRLGIISIT
jgi:transcription elongation factor GreB